VKLTILGCGTSSGVPRIGGDWGACDPNEPRNYRTRASILVQSATTTILVDTGPDMRGQLLAAGIGDLDAVIWTHEHADHTHGLDDLRQVYHIRNAPVPGYGRRETIDLLEMRFAYAFNGRDGYPPTARSFLLDDETLIGDIVVRAVDQPHGNITSAGLRFEQDGQSIGYSTDFNAFTPDMERLFQNVDVWVIDALRRRPHPTHAHLALTLDAIKRVRPGEAILTHMDQSMDYAGLLAELPPGVLPGHDGLQRVLA
jgi:phosphoribosyl 1,2-cyclic phosphate phosphodiesterase